MVAMTHPERGAEPARLTLEFRIKGADLRSFTRSSPKCGALGTGRQVGARHSAVCAGGSMG